MIDKNTYKQIIDAVVECRHSNDKIVQLLIKEKPEVYLEIIGLLDTEAAPWYKTLVKMIEENKRVAAIKLLRENTGYELMDAKNVVDALAFHMHYRGLIAYDVGTGDVACLNEEQQRLLDKLITVCNPLPDAPQRTK